VKKLSISSALKIVLAWIIDCLFLT
jgi:hypothetical protein